MTYVALGDSYATGLGGGARRDACLRTAAAYPYAIARATGRELSLRACSGATVDQVIRGQMSAIAAAELVTVSAGGNDVGFATVLTECAKPSWMVDSDAVIDEAERLIRNVLPSRLGALLVALREHASAAPVVMTGYPRLFSGSDCNAVTFFSDHEIGRLAGAADLMAGVQRQACRALEAEFVDVRTVFEGHGVCGTNEWIRGASWPLDESFHPNAAGHAAIAQAALEVMGVDPARGADAPPSGASVNGNPLGARTAFELPDLTSAESLTGARAWDLDPDEVRYLAERARPQPGVRPSPGDPVAAARLHALDEQVRQARSAA